MKKKIRKPHGQIEAKPWLAANHIVAFGELLETIPDARILEVGCGGSTLWLAGRAARVVSIDHDPAWARAVRAELQIRDAAHVTLRLVPQNQLGNEVSRVGGEWDVVFVDCADNQRGKAIRNGAPLVVPGGWLVADNCNYAIVRRAIEELRAAGWSVEIMKGIEPGRAWRHTLAICQKPGAQ